MNQCIFYSHFTVFYGSNPKQVNSHSHPTIQLVLGKNEPFLSKNANGVWQPKRGLLISPNHQHECRAKGIHILSIDIEPESTFGEWIELNYLENHGFLEYPGNALGQFPFDQLEQALSKMNWEGLKQLVLLYFGFENKIEPKEQDERIDQVVTFIHQNIHEQITSQKLCSLVYLSESRLLHLFKEKMGLPIRNYILWYRMKVALKCALEHKSLTEAAHSAGFADQSHMSKTFLKMIGVSPSTLVKNSKFVQVSLPD